MNEIACTSSPVALPEARRPIAIRTATMDDLPFLDALQKKHNRALGYFPTKQFEGYILGGHVLIAEEGEPQRHRGTEACPNCDGASVSLCLCGSLSSVAKPLGYVIAKDRYLKRDELGVIYQLCVAPGDQRKLIGASLVKAVFERSAYGCRLFCCWCAQDLEANYFWESLGFVPIAFRGGSDKKKRVHIFWQKRIVEADATPWWYPAKTDNGAMREDRLVLPIPPGLRWSDPMPVMVQEVAEARRHPSAPLRPGSGTRGKRNGVKEPEIGSTGGPQEPTRKPRARVQFGPPSAKPITPSAQPVVVEQEKVEPKPAPRMAPREKHKCDPKLIAAARELRDRYLERVNASSDALPAPGARYDVSRALPAAAGASPMQIEVKPLRQFPSAA